MPNGGGVATGALRGRFGPAARAALLLAALRRHLCLERLEQHHHELATQLAVVVLLQQALVGPALDLLDAVEHRVELARDLLPALRVEHERDATEVRIVLAEAALGGRTIHARADLRQRGAHGGVLDDVRRGAPRLVRDARPDLRAVVVLERAPNRGLAHETDQAQLGELPDVVTDVAERRVKLLGDLRWAGHTVLKDREDPDAKWGGEGLDQPRVIDVVKRPQTFSSRAFLSRSLARWSRTLTVPSGRASLAATCSCVRSSA